MLYITVPDMNDSVSSVTIAEKSILSALHTMEQEIFGALDYQTQTKILLFLRPRLCLISR